MKAPQKNGEPIIVQIILSEYYMYGLGSDGVVYRCPMGDNEWAVYIKNTLPPDEGQT